MSDRKKTHGEPALPLAPFTPSRSCLIDGIERAARFRCRECVCSSAPSPAPPIPSPSQHRRRSCDPLPPAALPPSGSASKPRGSQRAGSGVYCQGAVLSPRLFSPLSSNAYNDPGHPLTGGGIGCHDKPRPQGLTCTGLASTAHPGPLISAAYRGR